MNDSRTTLAELLEHPKVRGLVSPEDSERIVESLAESEQPVRLRLLAIVCNSMRHTAKRRQHAATTKGPAMAQYRAEGPWRRSGRP